MQNALVNIKAEFHSRLPLALTESFSLASDVRLVGRRFSNHFDYFTFIRALSLLSDKQLAQFAYG